MGQEKYAVLVGVNLSPASPALSPLNYAERDATELYAALTNPRSGRFRPADVDLLVGPTATARDVKRHLRRRALQCRTGDFFLVYYSGHGFVPDWSRSGELFLATADTNQSALEEEPDDAIRATFLRRDVFEEVRGSSLLILDSCLSAAYREMESVSLVPPSFEGSHAALLGYSESVLARESHELQHGEFTSDILAGLRGSAANFAGDVTIESLYLWLTREGRRNPLHDARNWSTYVTLARVPRPDPQSRQRPDGQPPGLTDIRVAPGPLDGVKAGVQGFLDRLLSTLIDYCDDSESMNRHRLDILRVALGADAIAVVEIDEPTLTVSRWTDLGSVQALENEILELGRAARQGKRAYLAHSGVAGSGQSIYAVPLSYRRPAGVTLLVAVDYDREMFQLGEPAAVLVREFLAVDRTLDATLRGLELRLLSALKSNFGRLPMELYERAFSLYKREISEWTVAFQAIVRLNNDGSCRGIRSFEALARRKEGDRAAPGAFLALPSTWGDRFTIERDIIIANTALRKYKHFQDGLVAHGDVLPISINVAVGSLLSQAYIDNLRGAIRRHHLEGSVTLEISEQDQIVLPPEMGREPTVMEVFRRHLVEIARSLEVHFAIDDFGVGYASLDRLSSLSLAQIKIDRSILRHPRRLDELELVMKIAEEALLQGGADSRVVVLEGLDEDILGSGRPPLTLRSIYAKGIRYIQGYITGDLEANDLRSPREAMTERIRRFW